MAIFHVQLMNPTLYFLSNTNYLDIFVPCFQCWFFFFFLAMPCSKQDLSSLTRDQTHAPCSGSMVS